MDFINNKRKTHNNKKNKFIRKCKSVENIVKSFVTFSLTCDFVLTPLKPVPPPPTFVFCLQTLNWILKFGAFLSFFIVKPFSFSLLLFFSYVLCSEKIFYEWKKLKKEKKD